MTEGYRRPEKRGKKTPGEDMLKRVCGCHHRDRNAKRKTRSRKQLSGTSRKYAKNLEKKKKKSRHFQEENNGNRRGLIEGEKKENLLKRGPVKR